MNNLLIVESDNDKYFIEELVNFLNLDITVDNPICSINDFECLGGLNKLEEKLNSINKKIKKDSIEKIGIILDADEEGTEKRIHFINEKLRNICSDIQLDKINEFKYSTELQVYIGCYIMNIADSGELETVLKAIKSQDSTYADCLQAWRECLSSKNKEIKDKDFDKFWVSNYLKFDTCITSKHRGKKEKYCANEIVNYSEDCDDVKVILQTNSETLGKKDIWDFENPILDDLKEFLNLINQ